MSEHTPPHLRRPAARGGARPNLPDVTAGGDEPSRQDVPSRLTGWLPPDWPFAVRAGIEAVAASWLGVVIPTLVIYLASSRLDAAAALSIGSAMRVGTGLWSLGVGGAAVLHSADASPWVVSLPALTLTAWFVWCVRGALVRARTARLASLGVTVASALVAAAVVLGLAGPRTGRAWVALAGVAVLCAAVGLVRVRAVLAARPRLASWWARRPAWVTPSLLMARDVGLGLAAAGALTLVVAFVHGAGTFARLHDVLTSGGIVASIGIVALQLAWLPTMVVWALAWLAGPGFVVGTGSAFAPDHVVTGALPSVPVLGIVPTQPLGGPGSQQGLYLPLVLTALGVVVGLVRRRRLRALAPLEAAVAAVAASVMVAAGTALACAVSTGAIGPGRLADCGPVTGLTVLLVLIEVGVGLALSTLLLHPATRVLTERGVRATASAASSAATSARTHLEAQVQAARERSETRRAGQAGSEPEEGEQGTPGGGAAGQDPTGGSTGQVPVAPRPVHDQASVVTQALDAVGDLGRTQAERAGDSSWLGEVTSSSLADAQADALAAADPELDLTAAGERLDVATEPVPRTSAPGTDTASGGIGRFLGLTRRGRHAHDPAPVSPAAPAAETADAAAPTADGPQSPQADPNTDEATGISRQD